MTAAPTPRQGGGTDYADLFAKTARMDPAIAVILTDLDAPLPPKPVFPLIWAVPEPLMPAATPAPPYGRIVALPSFAL